MKRAFPVTVRSLGVVLIASCSFFLALHFGQRTPWFKQYLYYRLLAGNENQRLRAASMLVQLGGQKQLIEALHVQESAPRDVARKALEYLWFNAAGPEAFRLLQAGYQAAEQDDFPNALTLLDRVVKQFPNFAEGWNQRASVYWRMGEYDKSIDDSRRALALNPNHYGAWQGLGICKLKLGDVAEACRCLRAAKRIVPHDEPTLHALSECEQLLLKIQPVTKPKTVGQII